MNTIYLLTGGNLGDRERNLREAAEGIAELGATRASGLYETAAWGRTDQPDFLNQCICLQTGLEPLALLDRLQDLENRMGRVRKEMYGSRVIDIDILLFGHRIIEEPRLRVPHPQLPFRRFALLPLAEIASHLVHPQTGSTIGELLAACTDPLSVRKLR